MKLGKLSLAMGLLALSPTSYAAITGAVFNDGNGDGIKNSGESGIPEIIINAYDATDTLAGTAISSADGTYTVAAANGGTNYRVEFVIPSNGCNATNTVDYSALGGGSYGTEIQFADGAATDVNYGVLDPGAYVTQANPTMYSTVYTSGNPVPAGSSGDSHALVAFNYNDTGVAGNTVLGPAGSGAEYDVVATARNIGTTAGMAVSKQANRIFVSALLKRHAGLGQDGSGAIYMLDPANPPAAGAPLSSFINLDALGFATGGSGSYTSTSSGFHDVVGTNVERGLNVDKTQPSFDNSSFGQVGKVALGDLDISDDGQYLFVTNLYDRKLYRIDLQNSVSPTIPTATEVHRFDAAPWVSSLACSNGTARPYGTKFYRGKIYIGVVCTGEAGTAAIPLPNNGDADDLRAYIYSIPHDGASPGTGANATIEFEFPLNYIKEIGSPGHSQVRGWYRWSDDPEVGVSSTPDNRPYKYVIHPQPILSDIEFDNDGSMMLGFMDRSGHQWGLLDYPPGNDPALLVTSIIEGDLLRVYKDSSNGNCNYILEANGVAGPSVSNGPSGYSVNGGYDLGIWPHPYQGPGAANGVGAAFTGYTYTDVNNPDGKEFYWGDWADPYSGRPAALAAPYNPPHNPNQAATEHREVSMGMLAFWPSSGSILSTAMDPSSRIVNAGGVTKLSNTTGEKLEGYSLYHSSSAQQQGSFAKANGIGDVEILLEEPPLEIGNRVWCDSNEDGIQTADETIAPSGVTITLTCGAESATTTTDASGGYYFNDTNWAASANVSSLEIPRGGSCVVSLDVSGANQTAIDTVCGGSTLSLLNQSSGISGATTLSDDVRDSDGTQAGTVVSTAAFNVGQDGQSNHTFDFGFRATPITGSITIIKDATLDDPQDFAFIATGTGTSNFSLDDDADATLSNTQIFTGLADGAYSFTETAVANWLLNGISCTGNTNSTITTNATGVDITLSSNEDIVCTFYSNTHTCPAGQLQNIATITANETETTYANNSDAACLEVTSPTCSIVATAVVNACVNGGNDSDTSNDTYTIALTVTGLNASANFDYSSAPAGVSGTAIPFASSPYTTPALIIESTDSPLTLTVTDSVDNNCSTTVTPVITEPATCSSTPEVDLRVTKIVDKTTAVSGDTLVYTITVTNGGPSDATGVQVTDNLPTGVTYQSHVAEAGTTFTSGTGIWDVGGVTVGQTVTLEITATVD